MEMLNTENCPVDPQSWEIVADEETVRDTINEEIIGDESGVMRVEFGCGGVIELFFGRVDGDPRVRMRSRVQGTSSFASVDGQWVAPVAEAVRRMFQNNTVSRVHFNEWATR